MTKSRSQEYLVASEFDVEKDQIPLAEADLIASDLGLPVPPSVYEVTAEGRERQLGRLAGGVRTAEGAICKARLWRVH